MKYFASILLMLFLQYCIAQKKEFHSAEFGWTIAIPEGFEIMDRNDWEAKREKGLDLVEKTYNADLDSLDILESNKTLLILKQGQFNHLEVSMQFFDPGVDGNFEEANEAVSQILYETFTSQMPGVPIETSESREKIAGKEFLRNDFVLTFPNGMKYRAYMFTTLIGKKMFSVNVMFVDDKQGKLMLDALKASKFK